jgi:hypothetical protein
MKPISCPRPLDCFAFGLAMTARSSSLRGAQRRSNPDLGAQARYDSNFEVSELGTPDEIGGLAHLAGQRVDLAASWYGVAQLWRWPDHDPSRFNPSLSIALRWQR